MDRIEEIMSLIREEDLNRLGDLCGVDRYNTKILGKIIFKSLLKLILPGKRTSLRMLSSLINKGYNLGIECTFSGLSKRLKFINSNYFSSIYEHLLAQSKDQFKDKVKQSLYRFDSTLMFLIYKIKHKLAGFKIPLFEFTLELDKSIMRSIIILSGGNLNAVKHIL